MPRCFTSTHLEILRHLSDSEKAVSERARVHMENKVLKDGEHGIDLEKKGKY